MILSTFYESIMHRLMVQTPSLGIAYFNYYFGQDEEEEQNIPFARPAVLMEYNPMEFASVGQHRQETETTFRLHVLSDVIPEFDHTTAQAIRDDAHAHLQLLDALNKRLTGYNGDGFGSIARVSVDPYIANGQVIKHIITYRVRLRDDSAKRIYEPAEVDQEIILNQVLTILGPTPLEIEIQDRIDADAILQAQIDILQNNDNALLTIIEDEIIERQMADGELRTLIDAISPQQIYTDTSVALAAQTNGVQNYLRFTTPLGHKYLYEILTDTLAGETPFTHPDKFIRISPYKYDLFLNQAIFPGGSPTCRGLVYLSAAQTGNVPKIYVANNNAGTVHIYNADTKKFIASIGGVTNPAYGCFVPSRGEVWFGSASVILRINANTDTSPGTLAFVASGELLYHAANDSVYACDFTNNVIRVFNAATLAQTTTISSLFNPIAIVYHPIIDRIAVMNNFNGALNLINPATHAVTSIGLISGTGSPTYMEYIPHADNGGNGYFVFGNRNANNRWASLINVVSATSCTFNKAIDVGIQPAKLIYIPDVKWVVCGYDIAAAGGGDIAIIDVADFEGKRILQIGAFQNTVRGMVFNPDRKEIYYSLDSSHVVKCVNL